MALIDTLCDRIDEISAVSARPLIAVDGPDAAGKTTLADALAERIGATAVRASIDHFEHPTEVRLRDGRDGSSYYRDGFDHETFRSVLLSPFAGGADRVTTERRDPLTDARCDVVVEVPPRAVLIADGVFLQRPELRDAWSLVIYLRVSPETSLARARVRDLAWNDSLEVVLGERNLSGSQRLRRGSGPDKSPRGD